MVGVVFLNMGGPDCLDAVRPFLYNLFSDREIIRLGPALMQRPLAWWIARKRAPKSRSAYEMIGGKSPLAAITGAQAAAVEALVNRGGGQRVRCRSGMRYWRPFTRDVLAELKTDGVSRVLAVSLYPHYSSATSGSSIRDLERCAGDLDLDYRVVESFPDHPGYVAALAETVREGLAVLLRREADALGTGALRLPDASALVYSAHSLPKGLIEAGDPYVRHLERTITALEERTGIRGHLCFQSRSGPVVWLEPATDVFLNELAGEGVRRILMLPISFVSDHVETLYEIDILYRGMMAAKGVVLVRTPSLNDRPTFMGALADVVERGLEEAGWQE
jgi:ferrochelatase